MNARSQALISVAALALCGSLAVAQEAPTPTPPASSDAPAAAQPSPAPIERHASPAVPRAPRPPRPAMMPHVQPPIGPMMMRDHGRHDGPMGGAMGGGMERKWWKDTAVAEQLNLTPEQIKRMDTIFEQSKLQLIDLRANVEKQEVLLEPLLSANPVDSGKTSAQIDKVANARADLEKASAKMLLGVRGVLTPDQWTKLNERNRGRRRDGFEYRRAPGVPGAPPAPAAPGGGSRPNPVTPPPEL
jgi:Spy/CpxP family protein refolding chaperone